VIEFPNTRYATACNRKMRRTVSLIRLEIKIVSVGTNGVSGTHDWKPTCIVGRDNASRLS
jgi:hypothetical protein